MYVAVVVHCLQKLLYFIDFYIHCHYTLVYDFCREIRIYCCVDYPGDIPAGLVVNGGIHTTCQIIQRII